MVEDVTKTKRRLVELMALYVDLDSVSEPESSNPAQQIARG